MPRLHLLRVFCVEEGTGGTPLGVFLDGSEISPEKRQGVAADLGLSETVFVDDPERGEIRIFTPVSELPYAIQRGPATTFAASDQRVRARTSP